jgi:hypothetical protein
MGVKNLIWRRRTQVNSGIETIWHIVGWQRATGSHNLACVFEHDSSILLPGEPGLSPFLSPVAPFEFERDLMKLEA